MADTTRTFLAVTVPEALTLRLSRLQEQLGGEVPGVRWSVSRPFHITLAFLGDVHHADLLAVCQGVQAEAEAFAPFALKLDGIGAFPDPARPRVIWAGLAGPGLETLAALQAALAGAVARLHYPTDGKPFHPHVTLGRAEPSRPRGKAKAKAPPPPDMARLVSHYKTWHAGPFPVDRVIIFSSTLDRDGPTYAPLGHAPLAARKGDATP